MMLEEWSPAATITLLFYPLVTKFLQNDTFCWHSPFIHTYPQRQTRSSKDWVLPIPGLMLKTADQHDRTNLLLPARKSKYLVIFLFIFCRICLFHAFFNQECLWPFLTNWYIISCLAKQKSSFHKWSFLSCKILNF